MTHNELDSLLANRLTYMAEQVATLLWQGSYDEAQCLQDSINDLLQSADDPDYNFLYIPSSFGQPVE